ncbi:acyltransferase family protein [Flavobacterium johnsoniae]|jgi:hypothetical protein|uniref:acyltransferase family protein n=1 Tax=Flavobacterium johnsoniae TaxID=986 RepID=UPI003D9663EF
MINLKNFDNIRIVALISVLLLHTCLGNFGVDTFTADMSELNLNSNYDQLLLNASYLNLFKCGTVLFFIISGFLFEKQFPAFNVFSLFIKKKSKSLLRPYLILFVIPTIILIWIIEPNVGRKEDYDFYLFFIKTIRSIFLTNYWFVPALFVTLIINYFIKTEDLFKSLIFFSFIWLIFYVNMYFHFVLTSHTVWFVGFFFIFALGRLMFVYNEKMASFRFMNKNNLIFAVILFYILSNIESMIILEYWHNTDYINTLRIGNILYSFALFFLLNLFFSKLNFVLPINVSFYFIYLVHPFVLRVPSILSFTSDLRELEYPLQYVYNVAHFLEVATICFVLQQIFFKLHFKSKYLSQYVFKK